MTELPRWNVRLNATRSTPDYTDLLGLVTTHYRTFASAEAFLGPYNARQRAKEVYAVPTREELRAAIKQGGMNDLSYSHLITSIIRFCEQTKGQRALPTPHPSTVHSIQLPEGAFEIKSVQNGHEVSVAGTKPLFVSGLRSPEQIRFIIVRPKLSSLGTPSAREWEILFFGQNHGYIPNWTDTALNPRYAGVF